ncbi:hypothetical protein [Pseudohongiella nitratireducens]|nr:hypothetical protein [Pseudohongiella nitratireducens]MDF1622231.1 hypothetical protein [Pseudohongiella nitratireducens]
MHCSMVFAGLIGISWYALSDHDLWPALVYCITLCIIGAVSLLRHYKSSENVQKMTLVLNRIAAVVLMTLLVSAFVISPGTGIAAAALIFIPLTLALTN